MRFPCLLTSDQHEEERIRRIFGLPGWAWWLASGAVSPVWTLVWETPPSLVSSPPSPPSCLPSPQSILTTPIVQPTTQDFKLAPASVTFTCEKRNDGRQLLPPHAPLSLAPSTNATPPSVGNAFAPSDIPSPLPQQLSRAANHRWNLARMKGLKKSLVSPVVWRPPLASGRFITRASIFWGEQGLGLSRRRNAFGQHSAECSPKD